MTQLETLRIQNDDDPKKTNFVLTPMPSDCIGLTILNAEDTENCELLVLSRGEAQLVFAWLGEWLEQRKDSTTNPPAA